MAGIGAKVLRIDALDDEARILKLWRNSDPQNFSERHLPMVAANALRLYMGFILCLRSLYRLTSLPTKLIMPEILNIL
jgi:hypothetical protein